MLIAALAVEAALLLRPRTTGRPAPADAKARAEAIAEGPNAVEVFGQDSAPIKVEFYAPLVLEWHQKTIGLLRDYDAKYPGRIQVKLMPMGDSACDTEMTKRGFSCAVVFINGRHEFILPNGKQVDLQKKPNTEDSFYHSEDVITVLDQIKAAAPKPPWWSRIPAVLYAAAAVVALVLVTLVGRVLRRKQPVVAP
jgi:hypothetical protein